MSSSCLCLLFPAQSLARIKHQARAGPGLNCEKAKPSKRRLGGEDIPRPTARGRAALLPESWGLGRKGAPWPPAQITFSDVSAEGVAFSGQKSWKIIKSVFENCTRSTDGRGCLHLGRWRGPCGVGGLRPRPKFANIHGPCHPDREPPAGEQAGIRAVTPASGSTGVRGGETGGSRRERGGNRWSGRRSRPPGRKG